MAGRDSHSAGARSDPLRDLFASFPICVTRGRIDRHNRDTLDPSELTMTSQPITPVLAQHVALRAPLSRPGNVELDAVFE